MIKRLLLLLTIFLPLAVQAQYVTLTGKIQATNGLNAADYTINFTPNQTFFIAGTGVAVNTTTSCGTSSDGTVVGTPNPLYPTVVTPQFTGTLPPSNYYVEYTYYTATGTETLPSPEIPAQLTSTGELTVVAPSGGLPANATGMRVYIASTSGAETLQGSSTGASSYIQSVPLVTGVAPPSTNSTVCQQVANDAGWPTGTGYNVTLVDPQGNTLPGYPMLWQLLGPGSTLNLSNGLPYYHGVVTFPSPILASPLNHATQSISGGLNMQGYSITNVNILSSCQVNGMINAASSCFSQYADIGLKVNAALALCASQCTVYVPAGAYSYSSSIVLPLKTFSNYTLLLDQGAVLTYTGSGDAIQAPVNISPNVTNWKLRGGQLIGTSAAISGVHVLPSNSTSITGMLINGFTNGPGIWLEGANGVTVFDNTVQGNQIGLKISPTNCNGATCGTGVTGSPFSPNQIAVLSNRLTNNSQWGFISTDPITTGLSGAENVVVAFNDLEINGTAGPTFGALNVGRSHGLIVDGNYFEGSPRQIVLGIPGGSDGNQFRFFASLGPQVINNFFTDVIATPYDIELQDTADAQISGNSTNQVSQNSSNCSINTLTNNGTNIGETGTYVGKNHFEHFSSMGNLLCIAGSPVLAFVGANSYMTVNTNYLMQVVNANFALVSSGTSETVALSANTTAASVCQATPANSASATITPVAVIPTGPNAGTFYHPSGQAGTRWNISCAPGPFN